MTTIYFVGSTRLIAIAGQLKHLLLKFIDVYAKTSLYQILMVLDAFLPLLAVWTDLLAVFEGFLALLDGLLAVKAPLLAKHEERLPHFNEKIKIYSNQKD